VLEPGLLAILILGPLVGAGLIVLRPKENAAPIANATTFGVFLIGLFAAWRFDWSRGAEFQFASEAKWLDSLGISLSVGVDAVSMFLVLLTLLLGPICTFGSKTAIKDKVKTYYGWLLVLQAAMTGVFCARDLLLFYICFEFTLVPMYVLIFLYGSSNRAKAATKFFLYTFTGSIIALAGLVYVVWFNATSELGSGEWTLDIGTLAGAAREMSAGEQSLVLLALLAGFAVKVPLFPVHTWLPLAHTEAPTAGSVILAGVLLKLGTYGIFRFALGFVPDAVESYAAVIAILSIAGIIYGGLVCWVQTDVKKLVAYSSVAHMGFCILGLVALNPSGLAGSVLYMVNHGLSTGALFLMIGMIYERYHTRSMDELGGLASKMPIWSTFMVFFVMSSVGLPGLNGFVSEFLCIFGAYQASSWDLAIGGKGTTLGPWYAFFAGTGMIIAAIYLLYMTGRVVFGKLVEPAGHEHHGPLPVDLNGREISMLTVLAALCLLLGLFPRLILDPIEPVIALTLENDANAYVEREAAGEPLALVPVEPQTLEEARP